jgi:hypothetical protein
MASGTLVFGGDRVRVAATHLTGKCSAFKADRSVLATPCVVRAPVPLAVFRDFVAALEDNAVEVTPANAAGLAALCAEFGCPAFPSAAPAPRTEFAPRSALALSDRPFTFLVNGLRFQASASTAAALAPAAAAQLSVDSLASTFLISDARINGSDFALLLRLLSGHSVALRRSHRQSLVLLAQRLWNADLEQLFFGLWSPSSPDIVDISLSALAVSAHAPGDLSLLSEDALADRLAAPIAVDNEDALLHALLALDDSSALDFVRWDCLTSAGRAHLLERLASVRPSEAIFRNALTLLLSFRIDSQIISELPRLFDEFRYKPWVLLWRGSRDGFTPACFHDRCDGHSNTLTLIQDTKGNVFGGFTPVAWESRAWNNRLWAENNCPKGDPSGQTFLFTLVNPWNVRPKKFSLRPGWERYAIYCDAAQGPVFGVEADITIRANCTEKETSFTRYFGNTYFNDTGVGGSPGNCTFFTGSPMFTVAEIEVFEVIV